MGPEPDLKSLPKVDRVLALMGERGRLYKEAVREVLEGLRQKIMAGSSVAADEISEEAIAARAKKLLAERLSGTLKKVINLTGVVVHTNLGRAPLSRQVLLETLSLLEGYCNLEFSLDERRRGSRYDHVLGLAKLVFPSAEAALVVNNNAAAVLLILSAFAKGREVVVSRGELIEIGGGFRIPEVMETSGCRLVEVGTTNRTRLEDYEKAIGPETALLFKAHRSNFRLVGFTEEVGFSDLASLARRHGLIFVADLGSGRVADLPVLEEEPKPEEVLRAGADLVCFSCDKVLGGPQAGLILGKAHLISSLRRHPLLRALRVGKFTIAALEATLRRYAQGRLDDIPVIKALSAPPEVIRLRCRRLIRLARRLGAHEGTRLQVVPCFSQSGGGSMPERGIPSYGVTVEVEGLSEVEVEEALRSNDPPILARLEKGQVVLDLRTMLEGEEVVVARAIANLKA